MKNEDRVQQRAVFAYICAALGLAGTACAADTADIGALAAALRPPAQLEEIGSVELPDGVIAGNSPVLAVGPSGVYMANVVYFPQGGGLVEVRRFDPTTGAWTRVGRLIERMVGDVGFWVENIAVDARGRIHVLYYDDPPYATYAEHHIRYAVYTGGRWQVSTVAAAFSTPYECDEPESSDCSFRHPFFGQSMALDAAGNPQVLFLLYGELQHAQLRGTRWVATPTNVDLDEPRLTSAIVDDDSVLHFFTHDSATDEIVHAWRSLRSPSRAWSRAASGPFVGPHNFSVALHDGGPIFAFTDFSDATVVRVALVGDDGRLEELPAPPVGGTQASSINFSWMGVDGEGTVHLVTDSLSHDTWTGSVDYTTFAAGEWSEPVSVLDDGTYHLHRPTLATHADGAHVVISSFPVDFSAPLHMTYWRGEK